MNDDLNWVNADQGTHIVPKGLICALTLYQMTCPEAKNSVSFAVMKNSLAYISGGVIVAVMFLAVFVGGANAGDCPRSQSADAPAAKGHH